MRSGVTLIELIMTITLTAVLAIPIGMLLSEELGQAMKAQEYTVAMNLARYELEAIDSRNDFFLNPYLSIDCPSGNPQTQTIPNYAGYFYDLTRRVECVQGNCCSAALGSQGVKRIHVTVTKSGSSESLATLVTYRTKHVLFGN